MLAHVALALVAATAFASPTPVDDATVPAPAKAFTFVSALSCGMEHKYYVSWVGAQIGNGRIVGVHEYAYFVMIGFYLPAGGQGQIEILNKCIDAGSNPANGGQLELWDCSDVPQQQWKIHDNKVELVGYNLCFDVRDGNLAEEVLQLWQCYDGNPNQEFYVASVDGT